MKRKETIYVIGHKNPDTDSICSAIVYAKIKNLTDKANYIPKRAGQINEETRYVLNRFKAIEPEFINDVGTQVKDIKVNKTPGVRASISIKKAWNLMKKSKVVTLPIVRNSILEGLITVGDIANSYMEVYGNTILSEARTQYKNIIETIEGTLITGNDHAYFHNGKVVISAANNHHEEHDVEKDDLVILGSSFESQNSAIECGASCLVVCCKSEIDERIIKKASENSCVLVSTNHDSFTVARLINQSIPIKYFMKKENLVTFKTEEFTEDIKSIMASKSYREFPVIDSDGYYYGMISRRNLLNMHRKKVILVDHNEKSQAVDGIEEAEIVEIIDHHRLGSLETFSPVYFRNQPLGCTSTILYLMCGELGVEIDKQIAGLMCSAIISDTLMFRSPTCTKIDEQAALVLSKIAGIKIESYARQMFNAGSNLKEKTPEEIFYQDFKKFSAADISFGVGQINSMNKEELNEIKEKILLFIEKAYKSEEQKMLFFMLTDIISEKTELIYYGDGAKELIEDAFNIKTKKNTFTLKGVVSRKKQLIPEFMEALQQ